MRSVFFLCFDGGRGWVYDAWNGRCGCVCVCVCAHVHIRVWEIEPDSRGGSIMKWNWLFTVRQWMHGAQTHALGDTSTRTPLSCCRIELLYTFFFPGNDWRCCWCRFGRKVRCKQNRARCCRLSTNGGHLVWHWLGSNEVANELHGLFDHRAQAVANDDDDDGGHI